MQEIARFQARVGMRLILWSVPSVVAGVILIAAGSPLLRGIGLHAVIWGAVDGALGVFGVLRGRRQFGRYPDEMRELREARRFRRILVVNGILDPVYLAAGAAVAILFRTDPFLLGNGIGVVIQAAFLLLFDWIHVLRIPIRVPAWYSPEP